MQKKILAELNLRCGKAVVYELCGRDARAMMRIQANGGGVDETLPMLMQHSLTIDGKEVDIAFLDDMPMSDFNAVAQAVMQNFTATEARGS